MTISLTNTEIEKISNYVTQKQPNYAGMYQYIFDTYGSQMKNQQSYWFREAASINSYLNYVAEPHIHPYTEPTQSAYFIQQINKESLRLSGLDYSDKKIQEITNAIAQNVYKDIVENNHIPDMTSQVNNDIKAAIDVGGLDISQ